MNTIISNNIQIQSPVDSIFEYAESNLILPNPNYIKKERMGFWTGNEPRELRLYERHGDTLVFPFGLVKTMMPMIRDGTFQTAFSQDEEIDYGEDVPLYDYQTTAVDSMVSAKYGILQSAAGSGKTQMGIAIIKKWKRKALWLCHTADLLKQSKERAERYMDSSLIGTITEGKVDIGKGVTFATVQTMCNLDLPLYRDMWDVVIVDEAHRVSGSPTQMTRYFKVLNNLAARHKYGLTATPDRSDGLIKATYALLGEVAYIVPEQAVADKVMKVSVVKVETQSEIDDDCLNDDGTINYTELITSLCEDDERSKLIASTIAKEKDHSCLILSDRLAHLEAIYNFLPDDMKKYAARINGKMTSKSGKEERQNAIEQMRTGEKRYLFATYSLAKEGLDIQRLDRLFLASPVKYKSIVIQAVGRVARTYSGKQQPIVYDFVDKNIGFCEKAYKERCRHYRKIGAILPPKDGNNRKQQQVNLFDKENET